MQISHGTIERNVTILLVLTLLVGTPAVTFLGLVGAGGIDRVAYAPADALLDSDRVVGLAARAASADEAYHAFQWLGETAGPEWLQLYVATLVSKFQAIGQLGELAGLLGRDQKLAELVQGTLALTEGV